MRPMMCQAVQNKMGDDDGQIFSEEEEEASLLREERPHY